jgi:hypothetical protein
MLSRSVLEEAAVCLSFANLCFLRVWAEAPPYLKPEAEFLFFSRLPSAYYLGGIASTLILATALFGCLRIVRRYSRPGWEPWLKRLFLLGALVPVNSFINATTGFTSWFRPVTLVRAMGPVGGAIAVGAAILLAGYSLVRPPERLLSLGRGALLLLCPLVPVTLGGAAWQSGQSVVAATSHRAVQPAPPASRASARVVWIILDEWDYRLTFVDRMRSLRLPVIDELARQSLFATNAAPPAAWTKISILSLLTGTAWNDIRPASAGELHLTSAGREDQLWSSQSNLFQTARLNGWRAAVVGWHLPYCRLLESEGPDCWAWESSFSVPIREPGLARNIMLQFRQLGETKNQSLWGQPNGYFSVRTTQRELVARAETAAANADYDLVFIHLPILHRPHFYDRRTGEYTLKGNPFRGYLDALELADSVLGGVIARMKQSGTYESSSLLVTADHWCRTADLIDGKTDQRIPFLLKLPFQNHRVQYDHPFNSVCTRGALEAILGGRIRQPEDLALWIEGKGKTDAASTWSRLPVDPSAGEPITP